MQKLAQSRRGRELLRQLIASLAYAATLGRLALACFASRQHQPGRRHGESHDLGGTAHEPIWMPQPWLGEQVRTKQELTDHPPRVPVCAKVPSPPTPPPCPALLHGRSACPMKSHRTATAAPRSFP